MNLKHIVGKFYETSGEHVICTARMCDDKHVNRRYDSQTYEFRLFSQKEMSLLSEVQLAGSRLKLMGVSFLQLFISVKQTFT